MGNLNKVQLIGRLGQDPEKRTTPSGHTVVNFSMATTDYFKDKQGNKQERTEWHRIVFWNKQADVIEQYCQKGHQLYVEGSLQTNEWTDKDGNKRYSTNVVGRAFQFLEAKSKQSSSPPPYTQNGGTPPPEPGPGFDDDYIEDDIPF